MTINYVWAGAFTGLTATAPMTVVMEVLYRLLPRQQQYPLPPSEIIAVLNDTIDLEQHLDPSMHRAVTLVAHFAYGGVTGALYGALAGMMPLPSISPLLRGPLWGLIVWSGSYMGLLPAVGVLRPATQHPAERNLLMITAHLVWGVVLGVLTERWQHHNQEAV